MADDHPKLTAGLLRRLGRLGEVGRQVGIIVRYTPNRRIMRHTNPTQGVTEGYRYHLRPFVHMHATAGAIHRIEADPDVMRIYEDLPVRATLDQSIPRIRVPRLWEEGLKGEGVRIAILDTGIDPEHPDFEGRIAATTDFSGEGPMDRSGHGTHCASVAAGSGASSEGKYRGVAPGASIYSAQVLRSDGGGMMSDVMAGIEWAVDQGVQIISLSLGTPGPCDGTDALCETCDAAAEMGTIICVAAGNDGPRSSTIGSPGCARTVITVGAVSDLDQVASFSSRGPTADGRLKPDVVLPGVDIVAARARGTSLGTVVDAHYTSLSGTSMATPHAAGVCALLLESEPHLTPQEIKARLTSTALDLGTDPYGQGKGRVDAWRARHPGEAPAPGPAPSPPLQPGPGIGQGCLPALLYLLFGPRRED